MNYRHGSRAIHHTALMQQDASLRTYSVSALHILWRVPSGPSLACGLVAMLIGAKRFQNKVPACVALLMFVVSKHTPRSPTKSRS